MLQPIDVRRILTRVVCKIILDLRERIIHGTKSPVTVRVSHAIKVCTARCIVPLSNAAFQLNLYSRCTASLSARSL